MIIPIELSFQADKETRLAFSTNKTIKSHDVDSVEFHIAIQGLELTNNHTAKILSIFHSSQSQVNTDCEIVDGKIIYKPDTDLISMYETVTSYVYVYHNNQSLDVCAFKYTVDLSKIDETALKVKEVYDQSYADLLANFEQALSDYKDSLPQADSVRAEINEILNQFNVDSQAKLSQFDADAQQVIADNQTAFDLAESVRNEAEESRVQSEEQRASAESNRISAESSRASVEAERVQAEVERKANEESREVAEDERVSAEEQRKIDHANRSAELDGKANKQQEDWITPTLLNGWTDFTDSPVQFRKDEFGVVRFRGRLNPATKTNIHFMVMPEGYRPANHAYFNFGSEQFIYFGKAGPCQSYFTKWQSLEGVSYSTI